MDRKTRETAVVIIPPEELWAPIQKIRERYDRDFHRWMPHLPLLHPFRCRESFPEMRGTFALVCREVEPLPITLDRVGWGPHPHGSYLVWLEPHRRGELLRLQRTLEDLVPDCRGASSGGYLPLLVLGQTFGTRARDDLLHDLGRRWVPLSFIVNELCFVARASERRAPFLPEVRIPLGASAATSR